MEHRGWKRAVIINPLSSILNPRLSRNEIKIASEVLFEQPAKSSFYPVTVGFSQPPGGETL
jgi:hypothetical protein